MRIQLRFGSMRLICILLLTMTLTATLQAQSDSSQIVGVVKDATGSIVPGASISAVNDGTGMGRQSTSNDEGNFTLTNLPPGYYTVTVEATGFKRYVRKANKLDAAIPLSMDVQLDVGAVTESVEVVAQAATVQADSSTVGRTVEATQIENMAMNGRNPLLLAQLKPGVRSSRDEPLHLWTRFGRADHQWRSNAGLPDHVRRCCWHSDPLQRHLGRHR